MTNNQIKLIRSLAFKKNRAKYQLFVVEGQKSIQELLQSDYEVESLFATNNWINKNPDVKAEVVTNTELDRISNQKSPNEVLAVVKIREKMVPSHSTITLILDDINDPGNMGSIIRICDWFGVRSIICSNSTVDVYNPKVVQSAMGSIFRVDITYTNLLEYMGSIDAPIYGAYMDGHDVKGISFPESLYLVMGNEANGISRKFSQLIDSKVSISNLGGGAESLNVAAATSILLHEICQ